VVVRYHDQRFPVSPETLDGRDLDQVQSDPDAFDALLQRQHYRLAYWRSAQEELNYRRFFTVDSLIGMRMEQQHVFEDSHRKILDLLATGDVEGLRVDHVDGLRDPAEYLRRLRDRARDAYIVVEKILAAGEELPADFPVQGTTGYEFANDVTALFVDPAGEAGSLRVRGLIANAAAIDLHELGSRPGPQYPTIVQPESGRRSATH